MVPNYPPADCQLANLEENIRVSLPLVIKVQSIYLPALNLLKEPLDGSNARPARIQPHD